MTHGILLLDKPVGPTSNAVLGRVKRLFGVRKAGHTGALDPRAGGLLPLCLGEATKICGHLLDADKSYHATLHLGVVTDSGDSEGEVVAERPVPEIDAAGLEDLLDRFRGDGEQIPPMHSALKHKGERLHELARRGEDVERPPRPVTIHALAVTRLEPPALELEVTCSKGTYIRSLAMDIGEAIGSGAHLAALRRTAVGPFAIVDAVTLDTLEAESREQRLAHLLMPDEAFPDWPAAELDEVQAARIRQGQRLHVEQPAGWVRMYGAGRFIGLGLIDDGGTLQPKRLFNL